MKSQILNFLPASFPWRENLLWVDSTDSTNSQLKKLALEGAPHGTILLAGHQTCGRGRLGRHFLSPAGTGIYMSLLLRPQCPPSQLMHLTCAAAVAMCNAVETSAGFRPGIKWTNDLVYSRRKLGGILTELSLEPETSLVASAIIGIGINVCQRTADFPEELRNIAASLSMVTGHSCSLPQTAAAIVSALHEMDATLDDKAGILAQYRQDCVTVGKDISLLRGEEVLHGHAVDVDEEGALLVRFPDGSVQSVNSGEVSIRGMYGYL